MTGPAPHLRVAPTARGSEVAPTARGIEGAHAARGASEADDNERLRRENAELRRRLKAREVDPRDVAERLRDRLANGRRTVRGEGRRMAAHAEEVAQSDALDGLHGNARRGLARDLRRLANGLADDTDQVTARLAAAADMIEQGPA